MATNYQITLDSQEIMPLLRIEPERPGPLLVIVPSIFGIGPDVIAFANTFAQAGALVYVLDSFWREHPGALRIPADTPLALERMRRVDPKKVLDDLMSAVAQGQKEDLCNGFTLLLGICFGGKFVLQGAQGKSIHGVATWHGASLIPVLDAVVQNQIDVQMDFGESDPLIPMSEVEEIRLRLRPYKDRIQIRSHPGAGHGFSHIDTMKYRQDASQAAKKGVLDLIARYRMK
ncbi:MAG: dienelactone hydrolase family protein [Myxococcota bacterium]|nr:dienelactone hydrolase family protein [Myxococcota bacterium]